MHILYAASRPFQEEEEEQERKLCYVVPLMNAFTLISSREEFNYKDCE